MVEDVGGGEGWPGVGNCGLHGGRMGEKREKTASECRFCKGEEALFRKKLVLIFCVLENYF